MFQLGWPELSFPEFPSQYVSGESGPQEVFSQEIWRQRLSGSHLKKKVYFGIILDTRVCFVFTQILMKITILSAGDNAYWYNLSSFVK